MIKLTAMFILALYLLTVILFIKYFEKNFMYIYLSIVISFLVDDDWNIDLEDIYDKDKYPKGLITLTHRTSILMSFNPVARWKAVKELKEFKEVSKTNIFASILEGHYGYLVKTDPTKLETLEYFQNVKGQLEQED